MDPAAAARNAKTAAEFWQRYVKKNPSNDETMALIISQSKSKKSSNEHLVKLAAAHILANNPTYAQVWFVLHRMPSLAEAAWQKALELGIPDEVLVQIIHMSCFSQKSDEWPELWKPLGEKAATTLLEKNPADGRTLYPIIWLMPSYAPTVAKKLMIMGFNPENFCMIARHAEKVGYKTAIEASEQILRFYSKRLNRLFAKAWQVSDCMGAILCGYGKYIGEEELDKPENAGLAKRYVAVVEKAADKLLKVKYPNLYSVFHVMEYLPSHRSKAWKTLLRQFQECENERKKEREKKEKERGKEEEKKKVMNVLEEMLVKVFYMFPENVSYEAAKILMEMESINDRRLTNIGLYVPELKQEADEKKAKISQRILRGEKPALQGLSSQNGKPVV